MTAEQIKYMVDRFLNWRLPEDFRPDAGISFKPTFNDHFPVPMKHEPKGTNLFDAIQATAMVQYMVEGMPPTVAGEQDMSEIELKPCPFCPGDVIKEEADALCCGCGARHAINDWNRRTPTDREKRLEEMLDDLIAQADQQNGFYGGNMQNSLYRTIQKARALLAEREKQP